MQWAEPYETGVGGARLLYSRSVSAGPVRDQCGSVLFGQHARYFSFTDNLHSSHWVVMFTCSPSTSGCCWGLSLAFEMKLLLFATQLYSNGRQWRTRIMCEIWRENTCTCPQAFTCHFASCLNSVRLNEKLINCHLDSKDRSTFRYIHIFFFFNFWSKDGVDRANCKLSGVALTVW